VRQVVFFFSLTSVVGAVRTLVHTARVLHLSLAYTACTRSLAAPPVQPTAASGRSFRAPPLHIICPSRQSILSAGLLAWDITTRSNGMYLTSSPPHRDAKALQDNNPPIQVPCALRPLLLQPLPALTVWVALR
jgi:hypothetical protein